MKKFVCLLALLLTMSLVACGDANSPNSSDASTTIEKKVVVGINGDPVNLSPWQPITEGRKSILFNVYQCLAPVIVNSANGNFEPWNTLMKSYDHEVGSTVYTVHLRSGITDTNGNDIKASDVKFSYEQCIESGSDVNVAVIDKIEAIDELTVEFTMKKELYIGQFDDICLVYVVSKASFEASPDGMATTPVGSTGYVVSDYTPGTSLTIEKASNPYWNQAAQDSENRDDGYCYLYDTKNVDTVEFKFINDASTMAIVLETHAIDLSGSVSSADVTLFQDGGRNADSFDVWKFPSAQLEVAVNCSDSSPMSNINLRMALFHCWDNAEVLQTAYSNDGQIAYSWDSPSRGDYNAKYENQDYFEYNLDTAKDYLAKYYAETNTTASDLKITILCSNSDPAFQKTCQIIQAGFCEVVGYDTAMSIMCLDNTTYQTTWRSPTDFDACLYTNNPTEATYSSTAWLRTMDSTSQANGMAQFYINDQTLQDKLVAAASEKTHSQETCDAFNDYVIQMAYRKSVCSGSVYMICPVWCEQILKGPRNSIAVTGLNYDWDKKAQLGW